ncbi:MAG: OFA family MFS transporter [Coriobacteriia bacterium]|nr:OFA family MFS transporter [Coriobacteriia bacterium]
MTNTKGLMKAPIVLAACVLLNLTIQILYVWSLLRVELLEQWNWTSVQAGMPFNLVLVFFATGALIGGRLQDKFGPRWVAAAGGLMVGSGLIISGILSGAFTGGPAATGGYNYIEGLGYMPILGSPIGIALAFGVLTGLGIGFGYGSVLPCGLKWYHPSKKGLIGGMVLGGFALASVIYAPITGWLLGRAGGSIEHTFLILGIGVATVSFIVAQFVRNPPEGYVAPEPKDLANAAVTEAPLDFDFKQMFKTRVFYLMFATFALVASIGLMMIGNIANITSEQLLPAGAAETTTIVGIGIGAFLISFVAVVNTAGRIAGGSLSDRIGRTNTLLIAIVLQMATMLAFITFNSVPLLILGFALVGTCFGVFLTMFPALTGDQFGLKNYGFNYGIMYMAYGVAGLLAPNIADILFGIQGDFFITYMVCAAMMVVAIGLTLLLKKALKDRDVELAEMRAAGKS